MSRIMCIKYWYGHFYAVFFFIISYFLCIFSVLLRFFIMNALFKLILKSHSIWEGKTEMKLLVDWMSPQIHVEILTPNVMVWGGGASERWLGPQDRALMIGMGVLIREPRELPPSSALWGYSQKTASHLRARKPNQTSAPRSWTSQPPDCEKWKSII